MCIYLSHSEQAVKLLQLTVNKEVCPPMTCQLADKVKDILWIECEVCFQWYHAACVGLSKQAIEKMDSWNCALCQSKHT